jgi:hypothetical protein
MGDTVHGRRVPHRSRNHNACAALEKMDGVDDDDDDGQLDSSCLSHVLAGLVGRACTTTSDRVI